LPINRGVLEEVRNDVELARVLKRFPI